MLSAWKAKISTSVASSAAIADRLEARQQLPLEPFGPPRMEPARAAEHCRRQRDDDEHQDRVEQHVEGHVERRGAADQERTIGANSTSMSRSFTETCTSV
jgi:hypothetical protein